jgi:hypothetical protein
MITEQRWDGKTEETASVPFLTKESCMNTDRRGEKPMSQSQSYGAAICGCL